jgi:hypothetical protein
MQVLNQAGERISQAEATIQLADEPQQQTALAVQSAP